MYSKTNIHDHDSVLITDYYDLPELEDRHETRTIKPLADTLGSEEMRPNAWHYPAGASMSGHRHREQEECYVVLEGRLTFEFEDREVPAEEGDVIVIKPDTWRRVIAQTDSSLLVIGAPAATNDAIEESEP